MVKDLIKFIDASPTAFLAVDNIRKILENKGFKKLDTKKIKKGDKLYVTRNDSSIIAFKVGEDLSDASLQIAASHTDCPSMKLKPVPIIVNEHGVRLNVEEYGGMLKRPWFDRPLSLAGRIIVSDGKTVKSVLFKDDKPFCIIPSVAPHLDREIEDKKIDIEKDLVPVVSLECRYDFDAYIASKAGLKAKQIAGYDLYLYPLDKGYTWGLNDEFFTIGHIDNLECAYTSLRGFIEGNNKKNINVYASFDNEEVGSLTRQGADSDFLISIIERICNDLKLDRYSLIENGMMLSCDNAHGLHPNHPELYDDHNAPELNKGIVLKYNARQSYCTDSLSAAVFKMLLDKNDIPYQVFANKTGTRGGSTLGNLSNRHLSIMSVDIGLAQWAMHSPVETAGSYDAETMCKGIKAFFNAHLTNKQGTYSLK